MKRRTVVLVACMLFAGGLYAQENSQRQYLANALVRASKKAQQNKYAQVNLSFEWEKKIWLSDMVHRRRPGFRDVVLQVEKDSKRCMGVLLAGQQRVVTAASCAQGKKGFELKEISLGFANGKKGNISADFVQIKQGVAHVTVSRELTEGIEGAAFEQVPQGHSLREYFGSSVLTELSQFFISKGVLSPKARGFNRERLTLKQGEPFFYRGKVVALVNSVPTRLPIAFPGRISEENLVLLRS